MGGRAVVLAVWVSASGCVVTVGDRPTPTTEAAPTTVAIPSTGGEFAVMRPGEFHRTNPTLVAEVPARPPETPTALPPPMGPPVTHVSALVPPDSPLVTTIRHLEASRPTEAEAVGLPPGVLSLLASAVQASRVPSGPSGVGEVVRLLDAAAAGLAAHAPLEVTRAMLCSDVKGFARYDPLPERPVLAAGKGPTVWVYLELRNLLPQPVDGDRFQVALIRSIVVRDATEAVVDQHAYPNEPLVLRSPRRDNFAAVWFLAPKKPGEYTVTMRVQEPAAGGRGVAREASTTLRFSVR